MTKKVDIAHLAEKWSKIIEDGFKNEAATDQVSEPTPLELKEQNGE